LDSYSKKHRILIVDDVAENVELLDTYLQSSGYEVLTAASGHEAIRITYDKRPDLILLDIMMPDMDGFEVLRRLRRNDPSGETPVIFLTALSGEGYEARGLELGAVDYITKPFDIQELRLRVRNALRRSTQGTLTNPVTGLPEGQLVDERLRECLKEDGWALLLVALKNLDSFREVYGFVASDDVLRAVSLMIHNAAREIGSSQDFLGHITPTKFVLVTKPDYLSTLRERIQARLEQSFKYFYPLKDRGRKGLPGKRLDVEMTQLLANHGPFTDLDHLKTALLRRNG